jgi:hypothetical protein
MKSQVLEAIGETDLQHPTQVNAALAANNRLKYYFSLVQMAIAHAEQRNRRSRPGVIRSTRREDPSTTSYLSGYGF